MPAPVAPAPVAPAPVAPAPVAPAPTNFGATIEFDQKVYTTVDTVYFLIVAPDYNTPNLIDVIGSQPNNRITISTSMDSMDYFTLVETDRDTGIFVGELRLEIYFLPTRMAFLLVLMIRLVFYFQLLILI